MTQENQAPEFNDLLADIDQALVDDGQLPPAVDQGKTVEKAEVEQAETKDQKVEDNDENPSEYDDILDHMDDNDDGDEENANDPSDDEETDKEDDGDPEWYAEEMTHKVDGEDVTKTVGEWLDFAKRYGGRSEAITRKEHEIAEKRKAVDAEADAVAWVKAKPERTEMQRKIQEANEAITRGYVKDKQGNPIYLSDEDIAATKVKVEEAIAEFNEKNQPPRLEELQKKAPAMFSEVEADRQAALDAHAAMFREFGFSEPEITVMDDPRIFLLQQELLEAREIVAQVEKAKERKARAKGSVVRHSSKGTKGGTPSKTKTPPKNTKKVSVEDVHSGNANWADFIAADMED